MCDFRLSYGRVLSRKSKIICVNRNKEQLTKVSLTSASYHSSCIISTVPDLPQGQLSMGPGPEIQGQKSLTKQDSVGTITLISLVMFANLRCVIFDTL